MPAVSKPPCRLHAPPGRTAGTCLLAKGLLPLLLCLGWLWGATPVAAQDEASPSGTEATGPYRNLAENHAGTFHLTREEGVVYATFRTDRSPVQFLARDQPEVLFTVPEGFRPVLPVTWEVSAEPVLPDGTLHPDQPDRRVFRMQVDREGHVRYVDDAGVDDVGHLRYQTMLAWPLAGSEPQVCARPRHIREAILAAVQALEEVTPLCSEVDWEHLARIRTLPLPVPLFAASARQALLGLTNLAALQVSPPNTGLPADLLAHTPRLERLEVASTNFLVLPTGLLRYTPRLAHLSLGRARNNRVARSNVDLPADLLAPVPHLESLAMVNRLPAKELVLLLAHLPLLTHLHVTSSGSVPETLLAGIPRLTHLELNVDETAALPEHLLAALPRLTHLTLRVTDVDGTAALPEHLLAQVPTLTHLTLEVAGMALPNGLLSASSLVLPDGFFAHVPRLTALTLDVTGTLPLTARLLDPVPQLTELRMDLGRTTSLPADFLTHAPHLETLSLGVERLEALPAGFLAHAPRLKAFHLSDWEYGQPPGLTSLPEGFLSHAPRLVELHLHVPRLETLPPGFLAHAPHLETLELDYVKYERYNFGDLLKTVTPLASLPEGFLSHAPRLRQLKLELGLVTEFPADFLAHAPQLRHLSLDANGVSALPPDFLARHPGLETVRLLANGVAALPRGFLDRSPNLRSLLLDLQQMEALPEGFLTQAPRLHALKLGVNRVAALSPDFLVHAPHLTYLNPRALNLTVLPADFLADAPHIHTLGLAMPLLEPTLAPGHRLWDTLQAASLRVKVTRPDPVLFLVPNASASCEDMSLSYIDVEVGDILEVRERTRDDHDRRLLRVEPWRDRELPVTFWHSPSLNCPYLIDARFTEPTLAVCAADREPDACISGRDHYPQRSSHPFRG